MIMTGHLNYGKFPFVGCFQGAPDKCQCTVGSVKSRDECGYVDHGPASHLGLGLLV